MDEMNMTNETIEEITAAEAPVEAAPETAAAEAPVETMADYAGEIDSSMRDIKVGDILEGTVVGTTDTALSTGPSPLYSLTYSLPTSAVTSTQSFSLSSSVLS